METKQETENQIKEVETLFDDLEKMITGELISEDFQRFADLINSCYEMLEEIGHKLKENDKSVSDNSEI